MQAASTILIYYFFSISLTFYNRYLFVTYKYPLSITLIHLIVKFSVAACLRTLLNQTINSKRCRLSKKSRITLDWQTYLKKIAPLGIASAADIGMSNWSLQYITVTLYTMSKSTVILFILFFALIFKLEKWVSACLMTSSARIVTWLIVAWIFIRKTRRIGISKLRPKNCINLKFSFYLNEIDWK